VVVKSDYQSEDVNICFSVLVELMTVLSKFRKNIVLVGGWIPWFLIPERPDGASNEIPIKIAGVVPFLVTKGMAIWESYKEKHAYDIYFVIKYYSRGIQGIIDQFKPFLKNTLVREGLGKIWRKFESVDSIGPVWVANFLERFDPEERERIQRDAFERVKAFLDGLGIQPYREGDGTV
jgi:hypothetical protein